MKRSNKILIGVFFLFFAVNLYYTYLAARGIEPEVRSEGAIRPKSSDILYDTIEVSSFQYISTDAVPVTLDSGKREVILRTYEDLLPHCNIEVRHDTLFISKSPRLHSNNGQWVSVVVKAPSLKGLSVSNGGSVYV